MTTKVEIRVARGSDPATPHKVAVEYLPKWNVWYIDINPATARTRGKPQREHEVDTLAAAEALASKIRHEIQSGLTNAAPTSKV
jgi:hypothetical protein